MMKKKAFTLIELMIVVAIIAIIAAIAIPNLLAAKMSANETASIGSLSAIKNAETLYAERDIDGDGKGNYWNLNIYGLYSIQNNAGTAIKLIQDPATAMSDTSTVLTKADADAAFVAAGATAAPGYGIAYVAANKAPKQGYYIAAGTDGWDTSTDSSVALDCVTGGQYVFSAYPEKYNSTGVMTYILNQQGVVYQGDLAQGAAVAKWPAENPQTALLTATNAGVSNATAKWQVAK